MDDDFQRLVDDTAVFASLDDDAREFICAQLTPRSITGGEVLIREGDDADSLYLIAEGRVRVSSRRDDGTTQVLAELGRGELVGEMALVTNEPRSATVTAVRDGLVLELPASAFLDLVRRYPDVLREVTTKVVGRLLRSLRGGAPTSPIATIVVVPLDGDGELADFDAHLAASFARLTGRCGHVTRATAAEALGDLDHVDANRLASWFAEQERQSEIVVHLADPTPGPWTDLCVRQADLILLVASARASSAVRPVEEFIAERRAHVPARTQLVLVHPRGTRDPRGTQRWLAPRAVERHHHVAVDRTTDVDRVARLVIGRGIGLVFSGGGARGVAGVGVLRALEELSVPYDAVGGVSIGALVGGGAARGQSADELTDLLRNAVVSTSPFDVTFPAVSLAAGKRVTRQLQLAADGLDMEDAWRPFFCVSTNLTRGGVEVHRTGPGWHAIRASFSIPGVFPPVRSADGDLLVDGGVLDNMPVGIMRAEHSGITVITVDVRRARDLGGAALPGDGVVSGWRVLLSRLDPGTRERDRAGLGRILLRLTELGTEREDDRGELRIRPAIDDYGIADFGNFDRLVQLGYEAARESLPAWLASGAAPKV
ncbi:MAG: cyclic nucleotide-binding and patatin-like phospholipase domain-containing protein [Acidimicrobiia bacterium]|jgi:predicted acylesterase/phospholipase RssA/CRP-like cAMP-binding protein